ncbi:MAG: hypothetical protein KDD10_12060 [Phaeodactylibacter sp.]|nr:hypothetical protein [Phaeodactylibacter sp.]MCB9295037.1 hypothetical protein [Lewinellaceae bacterium]
MAKHIKALLATTLLLLCTSVTHAAVRTTTPPAAEGSALSAERAETPAARNWAGRKWDKLKKRIERKRAKWEKRQAKRKAVRGDGDEGKSLWTSLPFILGIVLLGAGIILGIAALSNPLGGFFHLLAGLLVVAGIVLILYTALRDNGV